MTFADSMNLVHWSWTRMTLRRLGYFTLVYIPCYNYLNWRDGNPIGIIKSDWSVSPAKALKLQRPSLFGDWRPNDDALDRARQDKREFALRKHAHILVIGGGVTGLTTAYYLNKRGYRVSVVEQEKSCGLRNSFGCPTPFTGEYKTNLDKTERKALFNAIVKKRDPSTLKTDPFRVHEPVIRSKWEMFWLFRYFTYGFFRDLGLTKIDKKAENLRRFSRKELDIMLEETGLTEKIGFEPQGTIHVYHEKTNEENVKGRIITRDEAERREPILRNIPGAEEDLIFSHEENQQIGSCYRFCTFLTNYLESRGVRFFLNSKACIFERADYDLLALQTDQGRLTADAFVIANGAQAPKFARQFGHIRNFKRYSYIFGSDKQVPVNEAINLHPSECNLRQVTGTTNVSWLSELDYKSTTVRKNRIAEFKQLLSHFFPVIDPKDANLWMGAHVMTPDSLPIVSRAHYDNLFYNFGHGRNGFLTSCGCGKLLADLVAGEDSDINAVHYDIRRFWWWRPIKLRDKVLNQVGMAPFQRFMAGAANVEYRAVHDIPTNQR